MFGPAMPRHKGHKGHLADHKSSKTCSNKMKHENTPSGSCAWSPCCKVYVNLMFCLRRTSQESSLLWRLCESLVEWSIQCWRRWLHDQNLQEKLVWLTILVPFNWTTWLFLKDCHWNYNSAGTPTTPWLHQPDTWILNAYQYKIAPNSSSINHVV